MRRIVQTFAIIALSLRTIPARLGQASVAVVGIAGVVMIVVSVLSIGEGFAAALRGVGAADRALVMRSGADSEMTSGLGGPEVEVIKQAPGIRRDGQQAMAAGEMYVIVDLPRRSDPDSASNVPLRGIEPASVRLREEFEIVSGRMLEFGTNEVIAGRGVSAEFANLSVGDTLTSGKNTWKVVGIFETGGGIGESEIWSDVRFLQGAYQRGNSFQTVIARLDSTGAYDAFKDWLSANPQLNVQVRREHEYYAAQSQGMSQLINTIGYGIAGLMGLGALFGAVLTMYTAVESRAREIATLRALGFASSSVVVSVVGEAMVLGGLGGAIGGLIAYAAFNGYQTATMNWQTFSQVSFAFAVTPALLIQGIIYALSIGLAAGLLPAIRAARLPVATALREL